MEATWETGSPWGTQHRKKQDPQAEAHTGGQQYGRNGVQTLSARLPEDMIGYKGKGGGFRAGSPAHSHLTQGLREASQPKAHWHPASFDVVHQEDTTSLGSGLSKSTKPHVRQIPHRPTETRSFCRQEETGKNKTTKGTVGESWVGSRDRKWWRTE